MRLRLLLSLPRIALLCLLFSAAHAQPYVLTDTASTHSLQNYVDVFIDSTNAVTINEITKPEFQKNFHHRGNLIFGYLRSSIWIKVVTRSQSPETRWYLEIPAPFLEYVDFYQKEGTFWHHAQSGYYRPQKIREVSHTNHLLPLRFGADSVSTVYINVTGLSPKTFPIYIVEKEHLHAETRWLDIGYGIFFGILGVMFLYNFFIYVSLRRVNYLLYILTIVCTFFIFSSASGYGGMFLWPEHPQINFYAGRMSLGIQAICLAIFTISFLEVRRYSKVMYYALLALIPLGVLANILVYTQVFVSAGNSLITAAVVMYMMAGVICRIKGNKVATYYVAAWTIYLFGGLLLTLRNSGVLDFTFWTTHFVEIGAAVETIIIAFALGDRYRRYKQEKEAAQTHALRLQLSATENLERKVLERTAQLSQANDELHHMLETVKRQKEIIEHKNTELDAFFYRISHDLRGPVSSLLGLSALAQRDVNDTHALTYLEKQHQQTVRLNNIIDGLINLTRLNQPDLTREKIDFHKMIDDCIASFHEMPNFGKVTFKKDIQYNEFHCEWILLNAVLQNLIENAIKYSHPETPFVRIQISEEERWLVLEVEDNGHGIPLEHQQKIFDMFYRATQRAHGSGLGLYILKRSVDRLQGSIDIKSKEGYGSTFIIRLPLGTVSYEVPIEHMDSSIRA